MLLGNEEVWRQVSQAHYWNPGWSYVPHSTEINQAILLQPA